MSLPWWTPKQWPMMSLLCSGVGNGYGDAQLPATLTFLVITFEEEIYLNAVYFIEVCLKLHIKYI